MQLVLSWPVRVIVLALLVLSLVVDGAGYIYRLQNHCPLTGYCAGMPPNSPQPGYKPQLTGLTGDMLTSASSGLDPNGTGQWVVNLQFNSAGASLFGTLTAAAAAACQPNACAENHLTWWLDLTQT